MAAGGGIMNNGQPIAAIGKLSGLIAIIGWHQ